MTFFSGGGRRASILGVIVGVLGAIGVFAPSAGAVLVHVGHGQVAGVMPVAGVSPAAINGTFDKHPASNTADDGTLTYGGGPVMHGASPYLIFWDPNNRIPASEKALYERYLADSAADSGKATNVFSVARQYTDSTGFADYHQVYAPSHAITDPQPYPTSGQCTENSGFTETACLFDGQLQTEISRVISANQLPTGITGDAPEYFVITPPDVNTCFADGSTCADNFYCAYHSFYSGGTNGILYADMPTVLAKNAPKGCQSDGNSAVQSPNANSVPDVTLKAFSHEFNETITDPIPATGWVDASSGQENGDECNFYAAVANPAKDFNPDAFKPYLGGSAPAGTLYNQLIGGNQYYTQSEWSNQGTDCRMQPTASALTAGFSAPGISAPGAAVSFTPTGSSAAAGYSSTTWSWGDGTANSFNTGAPAVSSHTYPTAGVYPVTLTVVDRYGNLSTVSHPVTITRPTASFAANTTAAPVGSAVGFDGSASSEPNGSISSYTWSFGDGSAGSGVTTSHAFGTAGTYTVTLTVADPAGTTASSSQQVKVSGVPKAEMAIVTGHAIAGVPFAFDGSQSTDTGSTIASYGWSFGDGGTATGTAPSHTFTRTGRFSVTLTVTDASGSTASVTEPIVVRAPSIGKVSVGKGAKSEQLKVTLTGPGTLKLGSKKSKVGRPRTVTLKVKLSKSQLKTLKNKHRLTVRYTLRFSPVAGAKSSRTVTIKLKQT